MKKQYHSSKSKTTNKTIKIKFDPKDTSIFKVDWKSPNDKKQNTLDFNLNPRGETIKIEDNH